jgi:hypothetical protein
MSSASLDDSANVYLASGTTLNLTFTGTDTINQLIINGVQQAAGTWGSFTSSAAHKTAQITGSGLLLVIAGPNNFNDWAAQYGLTGINATEDGDYDGDGIPNVLEFAFGGNPTVNDSAAQQPTSTMGGGYFAMTFKRNDNSESDLKMQVQYSTDLLNWTTVNIPSASGTVGGVIFTVTENGTANDVITAQIPLGASGRLFSRVSAKVN